MEAFAKLSLPPLGCGLVRLPSATPGLTLKVRSRACPRIRPCGSPSDPGYNVGGDLTGDLPGRYPHAGRRAPIRSHAHRRGGSARAPFSERSHPLHPLLCPLRRPGIYPLASRNWLPLLVYTRWPHATGSRSRYVPVGLARLAPAPGIYPLASRDWLPLLVYYPLASCDWLPLFIHFSAHFGVQV
eukprot:6718040-Pyramimonas_sp.AAC.1